MSIKLPIPQERVTHSRSLLDKFWGRGSKRDAYAKAHNLVVAGDLDAAKLAAFQEEYGGDLVEDFRSEWCKLLEEITFHIASDGRIDEQESDFFKAYICLFAIPKEQAKRLYRSGARRAIMSLITRKLRDGRVSNEDIAWVERVAKGFGLTDFDVDVEGEFNDRLYAMVQSHFDDITLDLLISDDEWASFESIQRDLGVELEIPSHVQENIDACRAAWRARHGELEAIDVHGIRLKRNENAFLADAAHWYEYRRPDGHDVLTHIRSGVLYLTDDRVIMDSDRGDNKSIRWKDIVGVTPESDRRFVLEKARGKSPTIEFSGSNPVALRSGSVIAERLWSRS